MRDRKLSVAPFALLDFLECNLHKLVNEHATAHIVGHVEMEAEDEYLWNAAKNQPITLSAEGDDGTACILFSGIVSSMRIQSDGALKRLTIDAVTYSSLLDKKKHLRSFQNAYRLKRYTIAYAPSEKALVEVNILIS